MWHLAIFNALKDVDVVLAPYMGPNIVRGLSALGKQVFVDVYVESPEEAASLAMKLIKGG